MLSAVLLALVFPALAGVLRQPAGSTRSPSQTSHAMHGSCKPTPTEHPKMQLHPNAKPLFTQPIKANGKPIRLSLRFRGTVSTWLSAVFRPEIRPLTIFASSRSWHARPGRTGHTHAPSLLQCVSD
jgi:hypothetical protein